MSPYRDARPLHLGLHVGVGHDDALGLGDLGEDQQDHDALLGLRPELVVELLVALAGDLRVGLVGDPLSRQARAELVVHDLGFLLDEDRRQALRVAMSDRRHASGNSRVALATA